MDSVGKLFLQRLEILCGNPNLRPSERRSLRRECCRAFLRESKSVLRDAFTVICGRDENCPMDSGHFATIAHTLSALVDIKNGDGEKYLASKADAPKPINVFALFSRHELLSLANKACEAFDLADPSMEKEYLQKIQLMLESRMTKEACTWVAALKLLNQINLGSLLVSMLELGDFHELDAFVRQFDSIVLDAIEIADEYIGCVASHWRPSDGKLCQAAEIVKMVTGWCRDYQLPVEDFCPYLVRERCVAHLKAVIGRTFRDRTMSYDAFTENVTKMLKENPDVSSNFVSLLDSMGLHSEAANWIKKCDLVPSGFSWHTQCAALEGNGTSGFQNNHLCFTEVHPLHLLRSQVRFLSDEESVKVAIGGLFSTAYMIGIAVEASVPEFNHQQQLSLIQLATFDEVVVIDAIALRDALGEKIGQWLMDVIELPHILKLGYRWDIMQKLLCTTSPVFEEISSAPNRVDFAHFVENVDKFELPIYAGAEPNLTYVDVIFPNEPPRKRIGNKQALVKHFLGKPIDASEEDSDWSARPLRQSQLHFAASEAFTLVEIAQKWETQMLEMELITGKFWDGLARKQSEMLVSSSGHAEVNYGNGCPGAAAAGPSVPHTWDVKPAEAELVEPLRKWKFVADSMLQGLGKLMCVSGIDCIALKNEDDHDVCFELHSRDGRIILTSGHAFDLLRVKAPGFCYKIPIAKPIEQLQVLVEAVLARKVSPSPPNAFRDLHMNIALRDVNMNLPKPARPLSKLGPGQEDSENHPPCAKEVKSWAGIVSTPKPVPEHVRNDPPRPKFVADQMLTGLSQRLVESGVDCVAMKAGDTRDKCVELYKKEKRIVLSKGRAFEEIAAKVPPTHCFGIKSATLSDQVLEFSKAFKITLLDPQKNTLKRIPYAVPRSGGKNAKFVADTMIQGVGKRLRQLGLDVVVLRNGDPLEACLAIHATQRRIILTMGHRAEEIRRQVKDGWCYILQEREVLKQVKEVLSTFNIKVSDRAVMKVCEKTAHNGYTRPH